MITRDQWGARHPKSVRPMTGFDSGWFIHWLGEPAAAGLTDAQVLRNTQRYHMDTKAWADIAYSFAVGREHPQQAYELRGWGIAGGHTEGHNSQSMAIVFLLGQGERPTEAMLTTARGIITEGVTRGYPADLVRPHNAVRSTACPGPDLTAWVNAGRFTAITRETTTVPTTPSTNPYPAETAEALDLLAQHAGYVGDRKWFGPDALAALHRLKNTLMDREAGNAIALGTIKANTDVIKELRQANQISADTILRLTGERDAAMANREAAEAEVAMLRRELHEGGRIGQLLADLDAAIAKARA